MDGTSNIFKDNRSVWAHIDWTTLLIYLVLVFIGWISIYAAVFEEDHHSIFDLTQRYGKQLMWIGFAILLGFVVILIDPKFFVAFSWPIYLLTLFMLVAVLFFGTTISGSKSWFQIGGFAVQPAEFAKFSTALVLAAYLSSQRADMSSLRTKIIAFIIILLPAALILLQYDTGSALVFFAFIIVFYREGFPARPIVLAGIAVVLFILAVIFPTIYVLIGLAVVFIVGLLLTKRRVSTVVSLIAVFLLLAAFVYSVDYIFDHVLEPHQRIRIQVLLGLEEDLLGAGYNVHQSKIAIGSGGFWGKGFLNGTQTKFNFVPEQSTDFIFCTIGEEWGFMGALVIIGLFILLLVRLINLAERQRSAFARVYGYGIVSILFFHLAVNIGMTIGLVPVIGIPLPFISYGGSSLWAFTLMLFVFLKQDANRLNILL
ncbi:MAG: rod shape-determining protein RodA [Bacteroidales bacterium]|jgi:rod shape determining protein RodA|nr:rod shape-determining protein RodA [Bacteroidales bacterium]MDD3701282.1 rod shape-determining protein RodA [Bacteroidales bacterium]MDY0368411.1 rod shape-determining protein RodA [Bacteroidales bacterium]